MEEMYPAVAVPFRVGNSACESPSIDTQMDITRILMADTASLLSDTVTKVPTAGDKDCNCGDLDNEVKDTTVPASKEDRGGRGAPLLDMISETERNWVVGDDGITRESEEEDSLSLEGDPILDGSCSFSVASETSSLCGEDLLSLETTSEVGTLSSVEIKKSIGGVDIAAKTADLGDSNVDTVVSDPPSVAGSVEEEAGDGSDAKTSSVVLQLTLERGTSGTVSRSVFEVDYVPLWGFTSVCGRRPEMEDAVATVPYLLKFPIQMLIGDRLLDGMSKYLPHQTAHFFGVYDGHGGSQVANYCHDRIHSALSEEIEFVKNGLSDGSIKDSCQEQWKNAFTNCFLKVDAEVGGKAGAEPVAPETVGSTAVVAIICSSHIIVANCGDSRAVLCRGKEPMALSVDHKPNREDEYARIEAAGGKVIQWNGHRVFGVLAMSRSIGDRYLKPWIIPEPEVMFIPRAKEDECLILAPLYFLSPSTDKPSPPILSPIPRLLRFQVMASSIFNAPCTVPAVKGKNYFGLKPAVNNDLRFNVGKKTSIIGCPKRVFTVRASEKKDGPIKKLGLSDAECEAAVVAGNVPEAPPVPPRPAAPAGTPVVPSLPLSRRPRRNRKSPVMRASFQETSISPANFVYPLFIHEGEEDTPIGAMPGCYRLGWRHGLVEEVAKARDVGVNSIVLFPKVPDALKSSTGDEAYNDNGLVPRAIQLLKDKYPDLVIYTDVALDPYSSDGHDGIVREDGVIMNDETVYQLCKQAVSQARAGADVVSPSDMMDGRVGAIRKALDAEGFQHVSIMSYTAKYASSFYGPFREALESTPRFGDKKTYQMNPANYREALVEAHEDESEGADILLVKPGLPYLDIIRLLRDKSPLPIAAYQVSGEYSMIKAGGVLKMIDEERVMMESLMCLRRAGADIILTYFALQAARCLCGEKR